MGPNRLYDQRLHENYVRVLLESILWNRFRRDVQTKNILVKFKFVTFTFRGFKTPKNPKHSDKFVFVCCFGVEIAPNFEDEHLSKQCSAEMEFCEIDPRSLLN
jgi:hypothetical protein